jgi:hypothetical protein
MPKKATVLSDQLLSHFSYIEKTRRKTENLFVNNDLVHRDIYFVYYGLFLEVVTSFERFIEELFIGLLSNTYQHTLKSVKPKNIFNSRQLSRSIIIGERNYVDWLPYDRFTLKRAEAFFYQGNPFTQLSKPEMKLIEKIVIIRNALAHKSKHSLSQFNKRVIIDIPLTISEKNPIGFLRSNYTTYPLPQTRFEDLCIQLVDIAKKLTR